MSTAIKPHNYLSDKRFVKISRDVYPFNTVSAWVKQLLFILKARKNRVLIEEFYNRISQLGYQHIFMQEPHVLGNLVWPYIHKDWDMAQRFSSITTHYTLLKDMPKFLDVSDGSPKQIFSLNAFSPNTSIVLDRPSWFAREGEAVLNIFQDELRIMSVAFSLGDYQNEIALYVGGIQGIHSQAGSEKSLGIIKHLTKDFNGLRPRSFVLTVLRIIANRVGATTILAIDQTHRHHWHPYFKSSSSIKCLSNSNYDEIWKDNEGIAVGDGFYQLKTSTARKDLSEIESKKRSMYRKRFEMLDQVEQQISMLP